jgi:hypothetical protein
MYIVFNEIALVQISFLSTLFPCFESKSNIGLIRKRSLLQCLELACIDTMRTIDTSKYYSGILRRSCSALKILLCVWLGFLLKFSNLQRPVMKTFFQAYSRKKDACHLAIFLNFFSFTASSDFYCESYLLCILLYICIPINCPIIALF